MEIYDLIKKLYPICRSITGNGVRDTLRIINEIIPLNIKEEPTDKEFNSWTIPKEWNINDAYIKDSSGNKIIDFNNHNLHILNYSIPISKKIKFKDLKQNLYYLKDLPDSIPYITSYYKERWGFCLTYNQFKELEKKGDNEIYEVFIDSKLTKGYLTYADLIIPGKTQKEILISTYICHPSMCHDNLSGLCLTTYLAKYLLNKNNYYTYRFIFIPETIGSIIYINLNYQILKKNTIGGYVITHVGDKGKFIYLKTNNNTSFIDKITLFTLKNSNIDFTTREFHQCGSDERNYNFPNVELNIGSIMRSKYTEYKEYHTSNDDLNFVQPNYLQESFDIYKLCINTIETNHIYYSNLKGEPFLSKYNLIDSTSGQSYKINNNANEIKQILYYINNKNDIIDISNILNLQYNNILQLINLLFENSIIKLI